MKIYFEKHKEGGNEMVIFYKKATVSFYINNLRKLSRKDLIQYINKGIKELSKIHPELKEAEKYYNRYKEHLRQKQLIQ